MTNELQAKLDEILKSPITLDQVHRLLEAGLFRRLEQIEMAIFGTFINNLSAENEQLSSAFRTLESLNNQTIRENEDLEQQVEQLRKQLEGANQEIKRKSNLLEELDSMLFQRDETISNLKQKVRFQGEKLFMKEALASLEKSEGK